MKKTFYSNGKLLISAEYLVLDGGLSLALPTKFGQSLCVENTLNEKSLHWKSFDADGNLWFETEISFDTIIQNRQNLDFAAEKNTLIEILHQAYLLNNFFIDQSNGYYVETNLTFPRNWGLGTSSTLINNIAQWAAIDAFELLKNSFSGSGYDIACAQNNSPILYQLIENKPIITKVAFDPVFKNNIYFVYLNQKQNSRKAILNYRNKSGDFVNLLPKINLITETILNTNDLNVFAETLEMHEIILSSVLEMQTIKESLFNDFDGTIKSLGAWGGDFVMVVANKNPSIYFNKKGYKTVLTFDEVIL